MAEYLSPGVYIEETSFRGKPIEGVSTSTAGLVGTACKGRSGYPTLVTSFADFQRSFGAPYADPKHLGEYLGHTVQAFFNNGGKRAFIVRVLGDGALAAHGAAATGVIARLPATATVRGPTRLIPLQSLRGIQKGTTLQIFVRTGAGQPWTAKGSYVVDSYDASRAMVTLTIDLPGSLTLDPAHTYFVLVGAPVTPSGATVRACDLGAGGNILSMEVRPADLPAVRLATRKFQRVKPTFPVTAGAGATNAKLAPDAMPFVREGDTVQFSGATGTAGPWTITSIPDVNASFTIKAGASLANYPITSDVSLIKRGAFTQTVPLGKLDLALDLTGAAISPTLVSKAFKHKLAALYQTGDSILVKNGGDEAELTISLLAWPAAGTQITCSGDTGGLLTLTLLNTPGRLLTRDVTGLQIPARIGSPEPLAASNGRKILAVAAKLVDNVATNAIILDGAGLGGDVTDDDWLSVESLQIAANGDSILPVSSTASFYPGAILEVDEGTRKCVSVVAAVDANAKTVTLASPLAIAGMTGDVLVVAADPASRRAFARALEIDVLVREGDQIKETFSGLTWNPDPSQPSFSRYYLARINDKDNGSAFISLQPPVTTGTGLDDQPATEDGYPLALGGGDDGAPATAVNLIGTDNGPGQRTGIEALRDQDDISLVAVPGVTDEAVQSALITHCELLKYRFAVLDGVPGVCDVSAIGRHRNSYDSKYAGYYVPWLETLNLETGNTLLVPPSGAVLGIYARSDNERGVHKAPANEVVRGITGLEIPFGTGEQDLLNPVGINAIREFVGRGIRVWGARTLTSDQEWKYINVRRLFIFLEKSIDRGTQWVVFEPNNEALWARVVETIEPFLVGVWKTGALMGTKPEEAFFVRCDRSTMTQDDIDNGRLVCLIGVAPTKPAEFVIFRIGQFTAKKS